MTGPDQANIGAAERAAGAAAEGVEGRQTLMLMLMLGQARFW